MKIPVLYYSEIEDIDIIKDIDFTGGKNIKYLTNEGVKLYLVEVLA